jgi:hypothetical protein
MEKEDYSDAAFNMRAVFYEQTKENGQARTAKKPKKESADVRNLRQNVKLHQKPLMTKSTS